MNYFLGLQLEETARERLAEHSRRLQAWELPARWVHPDDFHITICFLGRLADSEVAGIPWAVDDVGNAATKPALHLPGLGAFAGKREPRVIYAAVGDEQGWCWDLHQDLQTALGEQPSPHFHPHVTLCRPRGAPESSAGPGRTWQSLLAAFGEAVWGPCPVNELVYACSTPGAQPGSRYQTLARWPLGSSAQQAAG